MIVPDPLVLTLAVARPILTKAGAAAIRKPLVRLKVVRGCRKRATSNNFSIRSAALYSWLTSPAARSLLDMPGLDAIPQALHSLRRILRVTDDQLDDRAHQLLDYILYEWTRAVDPSAAVALRGDLTDEHVSKEAEATRTLIRDVSVVADATRSFEEALSELHPWRADEARQLASSWTNAASVVAQVANAPKPAAILAQWHEFPPGWFEDAPADWVAWLATLAHDHHSFQAASSLYATAIERGASDRGYLVALQTMAQSRIDSKKAKSFLVKSTETHPLSVALTALFEERPTDAKAALSDWAPTKPNQLAVRALVLSQALAELDDVAGAIATLEGVQGAEVSSGLAMAVAQYRLARSVGTSTINTIAEANRALTLAVRARDHRRQWRGPSEPCVVLAARAACLAGDVDLAWRLCKEAPEGDATKDESSHPDVRSEAGLIAALSVRTGAAKAALETIDDPFRVAEMRALLAADAGERDVAITHWQDAWKQAEDDADRLVAARGIAEHGGVLPDLSGFGADSEEKIQEIKVLAAAMSETGDSRLEKLRAGASKAPIIAVQLALEYRANGEHRAAGETLKHAAETWPHPSLWSMAADSYWHAGGWDAAIDCAERAISAGAGAWSGERQCRALMLDVFAASGALDRALEQARTLTSSDPTDPSAQWAHVKCAARRALLDEAWTELTRTDPPAIPRDPNEVGLWVSLHVRFAANGRFVTKALGYANNFPDDSALRGGVLAELYGRSNSDVQKLTAEELKELHQATKEYTEQFPDSAQFRAVTIDLEKPLEALAALAGEAPKPDPEYVEKVRSSAYPVGMLGVFGNRTYLEILIQCRGQLGVAHRPRARPAAQVPGTIVRVLDTSAAVTLAGLDEVTREALLGLSKGLESTDEALRDCVRGAENFGPTRTMSVGWNDSPDTPTITEISEDQAQHQALLAQEACGIVRRTHRVPWPELKTIPEVSGDLMPFLLGVDLAATTGQELWVDDVALASMAREFGCATVSTLDVINDAAASGRLVGDVYEQLVGQLVHAGYLHPPFNTASVRHAAELSGWRAEGAARFLAQAESWNDANATSNFLLEALRHVADSAAIETQRWSFAASMAWGRHRPRRPHNVTRHCCSVESLASPGVTQRSCCL